MSKKVLIISPHFPPLNAADMQRVRMSLPYFQDFGWEATVVTVHPQYSDIPKDELLVQSLPADVEVHYVKALSKKITAKFGLGSLALRSLWYYRKTVDRILKKEKYDLIYFSTTEFPVCTLGPHWKKKFGVPYVIDMQDPWYSDYYDDKPKAQRPPKYWFSHRLHKYLEPIALKACGGLISVSKDYITILKTRYPSIKNIPSATITFGAFLPDLKIAEANENNFEPLLNSEFINIVYVGRGGMDMYNAIRPVFGTLKKGLSDAPYFFNKLRLYFIGTSYAANEMSRPTIQPLAAEYGLQEHVVEITGRIGYYHTLTTLQQADALFIPGSDDPKYTASKIFPYLLSDNPLLSIFNSGSNAVPILEEFGVEANYSYDKTADIGDKIYTFLLKVIKNELKPSAYNANAVGKYSAKSMTSRECILFNQVINE